MNKEQRLLLILESIETEMQAQALWQSEPPDEEAMTSREPFCVDTLTFPEWIQWIMLPRFKQIIRLGKALPTTSDMHPMAQEAFKSTPQDTTTLLALIGDIDNCLRVSH